MDAINRTGPRLSPSYALGSPSQVTGFQTPASTTPASGPTRSEGFAPTAEASESPQESQAGEARASEIFAAWAPATSPPSPSAGTLAIQGGENTAIHQVHGVSAGQHLSQQGPAPGFSEATVYSSRPPLS